MRERATDVHPWGPYRSPTPGEMMEIGNRSEAKQLPHVQEGPFMARHSSRPLALVAGASRGLGLLIADELVRRGHRVVICSRSAQSLEQAAQWLRRDGAAADDVVPVPMDVSDAEAVAAAVKRVEGDTAPIDVVIHVAGVIEVGPAENTTREHFQRSLDIMTWGPINLVDAVLPSMRERREGRIGVVASVGGLISAPHLWAYSTAKFAAVGYTEGLAASLAGSGVSATVVTPGLMRTGSHVAASFYGDRQREYAWFAPAASVPGVSMDATRAAKRIVDGVLAGKPYVILTPVAKLGARVHGVAPGLTTRLMGLATRVLPKGVEGADEPRPGAELAPHAGKVISTLTTLGERARRRNLEP